MIKVHFYLPNEFDIVFRFTFYNFIFKLTFKFCKKLAVNGDFNLSKLNGLHLATRNHTIFFFF